MALLISQSVKELIKCANTASLAEHCSRRILGPLVLRQRHSVKKAHPLSHGLRRASSPKGRACHPGRLSTKCNTFNQNFGWCFPAKTFSRTIVDQIFNKLNIFIGNCPKIKTFWKEKSYNIVGVLVCSALLRFMRLGKVDKGV